MTTTFAPLRLASIAACAALALAAIAEPAVAQKITVKSATPNNGAQGTVDLDVVIAGNGFGPGAQARFVLSGTDNPDGIRVKNTRFVNSSQLIVTLDIDEAASLALFDIRVSLNGRSGKGTDLFQVVQKVASCDAGTYKLSATAVQLEAWPATLACGVGAGGSLDCSFGTAGTLVTGVVPPSALAPREVVVAPDGSLLVLIQGRPPDVPANTAATSLYVLRFSANAVLDTAFGNGGVARIVFQGLGWEYPRAMVLQPDGRIVVAGNYQVNRSGRSEGGLARLLPNGTLDPSFGSAGKLTLTLDSKATLNIADLKLLPDGKLLVAGAINGGLAVARLLPNGALDSTFGSSGKVLLTVGAPSEGPSVSSMMFQNIGGQQRIVLVGNAKTCSNSEWRDMVAIRLTMSGAIDTTFGPTGTGMTFVSLEDGRAISVESGVADSAGRIAAAGYVSGAAAVVRLAANGTLDQSFGANGIVVNQVTGHGAGFMDVTVDSAGRLLATGWHSNAASDRYVLLQRYLEDGTLDPQFGQAGAVLTLFPGGFSADVRRAIALQPDGRIIVAATGGGAATSYQLIAMAGYVP